MDGIEGRSEGWTEVKGGHKREGTTRGREEGGGGGARTRVYKSACFWN
jgi:hypothetical protein